MSLYSPKARQTNVCRKEECMLTDAQVLLNFKILSKVLNVYGINHKVLFYLLAFSIHAVPAMFEDSPINSCYHEQISPKSRH